LKKQFQSAGVPVASRAGPLLWATDGRLLWVPGLGADARAWAAPGAPALRLRWCAESVASAQPKPAG
jgi:tRNA(Ile)-lysidine synthase